MNVTDSIGMLLDDSVPVPDERDGRIGTSISMSPVINCGCGVSPYICDVSSLFGLWWSA